MRRILVLQLKRIGDAVLTAPALGSLRLAFPDAAITLVLAGACGQLGPLFPGVDVLTWRPGSLNAGVLARIARGGWDAVLDFTGSDRSALLALLSRAPRRAGWEKFARGALRRRASNRRSGASVRDLHTIDFHHALVRELVPDASVVADAGHLVIPDDVVVPGLPDRFVAVHPGTARAEKFWPAGSWAEVLRHLAGAHGLPMVVTGGLAPEEQAHLAEVKRAAGVDVLDLSGKLTLAQLGRVASACRAAVTVDTGMMHLLAAWERPQVCLFGPTNPWHWAPRHAAARILRGAHDAGRTAPKTEPQPMAALPAARVTAALDDLLRGGAGAPTLTAPDPL